MTRSPASGAVPRAPNDFVWPGVAVGSKAVFLTFDGNSLNVFDTAARRWSKVSFPADVPKAVGASVAALGGKAIIFGFGNDVIGVYDTTTGAWSTAPISVPRDEAYPAVVGDQVLFAGGRAAPPFTPIEDAVDIYTDTAPAAALAGSIVAERGGTAMVSVSNSGDAPLTGPFIVNVYAARRRDLMGAVLLGSATIQASLAAGGSISLPVRLSVPSKTAAGNYYLLGAVADSGGRISPIASTSKAFAVAARGAKTGHAL